MFLILFLATCGQNPSHPDWVKQFVHRFEAFDNIHVEGISSGGAFHPDAVETEIKFYKTNKKMKYIEFPINVNTQDKLDESSSFEIYSNPNGHFRVQTDFKTGKIALTDGYLLESNKKVQYKVPEVKNDLVGLSGCFAYSSLESKLNPCYTMSELFGISTVTVSEDRLLQKNASKIVAKSTWGTVTFWVDKPSLKPLKIVSVLTGSCKMANGLILSAVEANREYKTISQTREIDYSYEPSFSAEYPKQVIIKSINVGSYNGEEIVGSGTNVITYKTIEKWTRDDASVFRISSTAKNGTPFHLSTHPQITYHLEDGQLVLSANHQFLNKISQSVFGGPGFWQRLALILVPLVLTAALGLFLWIRWRPRAR